jgi:hypothetical protein
MVPSARLFASMSASILEVTFLNEQIPFSISGLQIVSANTSNCFISAHWGRPIQPQTVSACCKDRLNSVSSHNKGLRQIYHRQQSVSHLIPTPRSVSRFESDMINKYKYLVYWTEDQTLLSV